MTEKANRFRFWYVKSSAGDSMRATTPEEAEEWLLDYLDRSGGEDADIVEQLLTIYLRTRQPERALAAADRLYEVTEGDDERAYTLFSCGQIAERRRDYTTAERLYRRAHSLAPPWPDAQYWIKNNLGFCLNTLGRFGEAEEFLRVAIALCPDRSNAFKNMGLCYQGRELFEKAAAMFVAATRVNAADPRSLVHLEELLKARPELTEAIPGISETLENCREAVERARAMAPDYRAYWEILRVKRKGDRGNA